MIYIDVFAISKKQLRGTREGENTFSQRCLNILGYLIGWKKCT